MQRLLPLSARPSDGVDLRAHYADGWLDRGGLRVNFVASADGAATADGRSAGLQTHGDNRVFAALRDLADVVVAGAGTIRTEGYTAIALNKEQITARRRLGLAERLPIAVVSRSLRLDPQSPLFTETPESCRTIVLTSQAGDSTVSAALHSVADVIVCGETDVEPKLARQALEQRGLRRILCEGGPTLFAQLARAGIVDEVCLSITPMLTGPGAGRIVAGDPWRDNAIPLRLSGLLEEDGTLFCRYRTD